MSFPRRTLEGLAKTIADLKQMIQNVAIPQGTVWWFHNRTTAPVGWAICNGSNGTPNLIGRYPLGATSDIGGTIEAGLPDIELLMRINTARVLQYYSSGAISGYGSNDQGGVMNYGTSDSDEYMVSVKTASRVNRCADLRMSDIYGNSDTVTPPSVKLLPCMKL